MNTDLVGGRKFIGFIMGYIGWVIVLYSVVSKGLLTGENSQSLLFFLIAILSLFFGGNVLEKLIISKTNGVKDVNDKA